MSWSALISRTVLVFAILCFLSTSPGLAAQDLPLQDESDPGRFLFRVHCQSCHGPQGRGDGVMRQVLAVAPSDLTTISKRNDGSFPTHLVIETIDGRRHLPAHGAREMPVWGITFQTLDLDTNQEPEVERRIRDLVHYIESIQEPREE
ncbi:MAG: cytochrome c [Thermoanaerobaculia bacterium]